MSKKNNGSKNETIIKVGDISSISGNINIAGGNITTHQTVNGLSAVDIKQLFDDLYQSIDIQANVSPTEKEDLKAEVEEIQSTVAEAVKKSEIIDESFLARRFRNIARMAPDILDIVVAALGNPLAGLGVAVKKIADKAKENT